jgi:hypothetical protein
MRLKFAIAAALLIAGVASDALALSRRDVASLDALYKRSRDLTQSLTEAASAGVSQLNAGGDGQALDCLESLRDAAGQVSDRLMDVRDVASLAASLHRGPDRRLGLAASRRTAASALAVLPAERRQIGQTASLCFTQTAVQQHARDALQLIDDATAALGRLGAAPAAARP